MEIGIIHFSDIHFKEGKNVILNRINKIFDITKNSISKNGRLFIITSGDIANSGKKAEYGIATEFYKQIIDLITSYSGLTPALLFVPGNHDCFLDPKATQVRTIVLNQILDSGFADLSEETIEVCCQPEQNFFDFVSNLETAFPSNSDTPLIHPLLNIRTFKVDDHVIKFNLYNTAWSSQLKEIMGGLKYPIEYVQDKVPSLPDLLTLSIAHHPFNWQHPDSSKQFREALAQTSEIIITGHEHQNHQSIYTDFNEEYKTIHIESGALQDSDNERMSEFNFIKIDLESLDLQIRHYKYKDGNYAQSGETASKKIVRERKLKSRPFSLKQEFIKDLSNPGAAFSHPTADEINLSDLYTAPIFNKILFVSGSKSKRLNNYIHSDNALNMENPDKEKFFQLVLGSEISGKTSLLKYHYLKYYNKGFYPVYLTGDAISEVSEEKIKTTVEKAFRNQYYENDGRFETMDFNKIIILIDDFNKFKFKQGKPVLIRNLKNMFNRIIITGPDLMAFETYTTKDEKTFNLYEDFEIYLIQAFNPTQRDILIQKWYRLGIEYMDQDDKMAFIHKVKAMTHTINEILGKNFIPAYPIFILSFLQASENEEPESTNTKLHAYYYEMLITRSLNRALSDKDDIGFYMTLIKEYCYFLFSTKIRFSPLPVEEFSKFLKSHQEKYTISHLSPTSAVETLVKAKIFIVSFDQNITISYKYLYYYFVAKYMADNLDDEMVRTKIDQMADRVYRDEFSNIILFLSHLSKSPFIIRTLIEKSKQIFANFEILRLEDDVQFINELQSSLPEKVLKYIEVEQARAEDLKTADEYEQMEKDFELQSPAADYELTEDLSAMDLLAMQTKALRMLNILGQITRKYWGELQGADKNALAEETFRLGLRTMKFFFGLLNDSADFLVDHISHIVQKFFINESLSKDQVEAFSANFIFNLSSAFIFGVIKRIVNAIGTEKLSDTFETVNKSLPYNSVSMALMGIKLDNYNSYPTTDVDHLAETNRKNVLGFATLQNLIIDYLYMYPVEIGTKQQICAKLQIRIEEARLIAETSLAKKT